MKEIFLSLEIYGWVSFLSCIFLAIGNPKLSMLIEIWHMHFYTISYKFKTLIYDDDLQEEDIRLSLMIVQWFLLLMIWKGEFSSCKFVDIKWKEEIVELTKYLLKVWVADKTGNWCKYRQTKTHQCHLALGDTYLFSSFIILFLSGTEI